VTPSTPNSIVGLHHVTAIAGDAQANAACSCGAFWLIDWIEAKLGRSLRLGRVELDPHLHL